MTWDAFDYADDVRCPVLCTDVRRTSRRLGGTDAEALARAIPTAQLAGLRNTAEQIDAINAFPGGAAASAAVAGQASQERGRAFRTVLFTDIVASTPLLAEIKDQDPADAMVTTLALEKEVNTFFRLQSPSVIAALREAFPDLPAAPDPKTVFLKLRELRNSW